MTTHAHSAGENGNKWVRQEDGLFHCNHPGCTYTHPRAASLGRHTVVHSGKPYARNTYADLHSQPDRSPDARERDRLRHQLKRDQKKRDYAREYYQRNRKPILAKTKTSTLNPTKEVTHVNGTNSHTAEREHEVEKTLYFLAGGGAKDLQSAARALDYPLGELTERFIKILRATNVR